MEHLQLNTRYPQLERLQEKKHWVFRDRGNHGEIREPQWKQGMWFFPLDAEQAASLHPEAIRRIKTVASLVPIKGVVIGHEFPKLLSPPAGWEPPKPQGNPYILPIAVAAVGGLILAGGVLVLASALAVSAATTAAATTAAVVATPTLTTAALVTGALILADPVACVILEEDGTWLEVYSYLEPSGSFLPASASVRLGLSAPAAPPLVRS